MDSTSTHANLDSDAAAVQRDSDERVRASLLMHGLSEADLANPAKAMRSGGLTKFSAVIGVLRYREQLEYNEKLRQRQQRDLDKPMLNHEILAARRHEDEAFVRHQQQPVWQLLCGLAPENEHNLRREDRKRRVGVLIELVRDLARYELSWGNGEQINHQDTKTQRTEAEGELPLGDGEIEADGIPSPLGGEGDVSASERRGEGWHSAGSDCTHNTGINPQSEIHNPQCQPLGRTHLWEPLHEICFYLGISRNRLSQYSKEYCGLSAHELMDELRAATVKEKLRAEIAAWFNSGAHPLPLGEGRDEQRESGVRADARMEEAGPHPAFAALTSALSQRERGNAIQLWHENKKSRQVPEFHRGVWALELGFANYNRFYKACLFYYRLAPSQLELQIIEELLSETENREPQTVNAAQPPVQQVHNFTGSAQKTSVREHWSEKEENRIENIALPPPPKLGAVGS